MDGLKKVALIKSAKYDFAEVELDGNSLFIGANGAGKTTLLRAILYFYTADARTLGINSAKKISFSDYYFEYENSYIAYVYKKDEKYVLVVAYKDVSVKFRFCLLNSYVAMEDIFIQDAMPIESAKLWIKLKEMGVLSGVINSGSEYKKILYSKNHKLGYYTLFDAKEYEGFVKTLSNIFVNSKVDSETIKKVIVSSLQTDKKIDIDQIKRGLERFNTLYSDIDLFYKSANEIKKIMGLIQEYEQTKSYMQESFSSLAYSKKLTLQNIQSMEDEVSKLKHEQNELRTKQEQEQSLFDTRKERIAKSATILKYNIKIAQEKRDFYKEKEIFTKIALFEQIDSLKGEHERALSQKEFLTKEHRELEQNHQTQLQKIQNSFDAQKNSFKEEMLRFNTELESKKQHLRGEENREIEEIKERFLARSNELREKKHSLELEIKECGFAKEKAKKELYLFSDAKKLYEYKEEGKNLQNLVEKNKANLHALDIELEQKDDAFSKQILHKEELRDKEIESINKEIGAVEKLISPDENSLAYKIYANVPKSDKYLYFLRDDVLHKDIKMEISEDTKQIFALNFLDFEAPKSELAQKLQQLKNSYENIQKSYHKEKEQILNEQKNSQNRIYRAKRELNDAIKALQIKLQTLQSQIVSLRELDKEREALFKETRQKKIIAIEDAVKKLQTQQEQINKELDAIENEKKNILAAKKSFFTKEINRVMEEYKTPILAKTKELNAIDEEKKSAIHKQESLYEEVLKSKNIDTLKLQEMNSALIELQNKIKTAQSYQEIIIEYKKDKKEFIDRLGQNSLELKAQNSELEILAHNHHKSISLLKDKQEHIQKDLDEKNQILVLKKNNIEWVERFESGANFAECKSWGIEYIAGNNYKEVDKLLQEIENLSNSYRHLQSSISRQTTKIASLFDTTLHIKSHANPIVGAYNLLEYYKADKIEQAKELMAYNLNQIVGDIISEYDALLNLQGQIESLIKKISKMFESINIGVIEQLSLRYSPSNNKIIEKFKAIKSENENNVAGYGSNLFTQNSNSDTMVELLKELVDIIAFEAIETIEFEDSFLLEFRVIENGNDSRFVSSLNHIGSNGTDVLVKSMVYIAMLHILKEKTTKKELMLHVIMDEIGILSQRYLKELIEFANAKGILFVNGAPDEKLIGTYKRVSLISNQQNISMVQELIVK